MLKLGGVVLCMYESVTKLGRDIVDEVRDFLESARGTELPWAEARLFETVIRRNIRLAEGPSHGTTIFEYDPRSNGAQDAVVITYLGSYELTVYTDGNGDENADRDS